MDPVRPDYEGACISRVVPTLRSGMPTWWVPEPVAGADAIVLFVVDGLGWNTLQASREDLPAFATMDGGPVTAVVPSTTTTGLTSITTGLPPAEHGIVGYRLQTDVGVLNVLRWSTPKGTQTPSPEDVQPREAFGGQPVAAVTRFDYADTGFTKVHLRGARFHACYSSSAIAEHCRRLVEAGERFVYAYYGSYDLVAHMQGMNDGFVDVELRYVDRLVADLLDVLPGRAALVVTADHGHVHFTQPVELGPPSELVAAQGGEGRFRYLHAQPGAAQELHAAVREAHAHRAWVFTKQQLIDEGWLGPKAPSPTVERRIGDVILAARDPVYFLDPANPGERKLRSGHGSLTADEMLVPLLAARGRA